MIRLVDETKLSVLALLALQVVTSLSAITLLTRMSPAIEHILTENLSSIRSAEQMLAALTGAARTPEEEAARRAAFDEALALARDNVTEAEERPALAAIEANRARALEGDPEARRAAVEAILELSRVNHVSTERADLRARRLGSAGAWAAVLLGGVGLIVSVLLIRRQLRRVALPLAELQATVQAFRQGDRHRRTNPSGAPAEFREVGKALDELIDRALAPQRALPPGSSAGVERAALLHLLDRTAHPALVIDPAGRPLAAGQAALDRLHAEGGAELRAALEGVPRATEESLPPGVKRTPLVGGAWLVELGAGAS